MYTQSHTPTVVQGGVDGPPPPWGFEMLQYFETILPSVDAIIVLKAERTTLAY